LRAVILDWAGTVVDYGSFAPARAFVEVFQRYGLGVTTAEARAPMGLSKKEHLRAIARQDAIAGQWESVHHRPFTETDLEQMYAEFLPFQVACLFEHADLIPGVPEAVAEIRGRDLKVGTTTGYSRPLMEALLPIAGGQGFTPDAWCCPDDVPAGRPAPWMCFRNAELLQAYPMSAFVKVGDTLPDIAEGRNAGTWTIGLTKTGNELGLTPAEIAALPPGRLDTLLAAIGERMRAAGAHYVAETLADVPPLLDDIGARLRAGERP
jgi:phosphonoacetaldehyde hydrolase